ncbi:MAG TPA: Ig-like domain-containing protein, partial [Blastocatellia bacterium]|nr:Ig-like domain-containing protein [Blastocatellia bacterium]
MKRLQPIQTTSEDEKDFQIRDRSLPPPRAGKTVETAFPPPETDRAPDAIPAGPLEVLRYSPEGDVPLAPQLSVTFSQPMVAVTSHADTVASGVPVRLTPQPEGRWRWVGTKTLLFETAGRFPMATDYRVEVPAATKSAAGAVLAAAKRWSFKTPPPTLKSSYPIGGPYRRDPLIFVEFDQAIDAAAVLKTVHVRAANAEWPTRLATAEEIAADRDVSRMAEAAEKGRWLAFRVVDSRNSKSSSQLPAAAEVSITIGPGTPSAEGPLRTVAPQEFSFNTYGPLRVVRHECGYNFSCSPFDQWTVQFTNPLDAQSFETSMVKVEPEIAGMKTAIYGNTLAITGVKKGRTTYRVQLAAGIRDEFGQTLGQNVALSFAVKSAPPALASQGNQFVVIDPAGKPHFSVFSINYANLKARLYRVGPEHWNQFIAFMRSNNDNTERTPPGRLVASNTVAVEAQPDEMAETRIDLSPALEGGFGHVLVIVEPTVQPQNRWERRRVVAWAQVTGIGLDAFVDGTELIGWATSLKDGRPLDGVEMSI